MNRRLAILWRIWDILEEMDEKELAEILLWLKKRAEK